MHQLIKCFPKISFYAVIFALGVLALQNYNCRKKVVEVSGCVAVRDAGPVIHTQIIFNSSGNFQSKLNQIIFVDGRSAGIN